MAKQNVIVTYRSIFLSNQILRIYKLMRQVKAIKRDVLMYGYHT